MVNSTPQKIKEHARVSTSNTEQYLAGQCWDGKPWFCSEPLGPLDAWQKTLIQRALKAHEGKRIPTL